MKRFILVLLVVAFLPVTKVHAQMVVADGLAHTLLATYKALEQCVFAPKQEQQLEQTLSHSRKT